MALSSVRPLSALLILVIAFGQCELTRLPPVVHDDQPDDVNLKIVNGHYAEDHSVFPFQAYIFTVSKMRCDQATGMCQLSGSACGGTIVNAQFILTAAHVSFGSTGCESGHLASSSVKNVRAPLLKESSDFFLKKI